MTALAELASVLRSKNAGIGYLTIDILFPDAASYEAAELVVTREAVADAYGVRPGQITDFVAFDEGFAIKATLPRPHLSGGGGLGETDMFGSGQYAPMLDIEVPFPRDPGSRG